MVVMLSVEFFSRWGFVQGVEMAAALDGKRGEQLGLEEDLAMLLCEGEKQVAVRRGRRRRFSFQKKVARRRRRANRVGSPFDGLPCRWCWPRENERRKRDAGPAGQISLG
jgi:hypothetical protein